MLFRSYKSNVNTSLYRYTADSQSVTNIIFNNITPPSLNTIINRCLKLRYTLYVAVAGNGALPNIFPDGVYQNGNPVLTNVEYGQISLVDSPIQDSTTAIELRINGSSTSISPNDYIQLYSHMASKDDLNMFSTTYPHQKDNMCIYQIPTVEIGRAHV